MKTLKLIANTSICYTYTKALWAHRHSPFYDIYVTAGEDILDIAFQSIRFFHI